MTPPSSASSGAAGSTGATVVRGLSGGLGVLVTLATAAGLAGSWWWPFDLIASFRPQYSLVLFVLAALHLSLRSRAWAAVFGVAALVNGVMVAPYLSGNLAEDASGPHLSVLSFNVGVSNPQRTEVAEWMAAEAPDVVFLFESSFEWEDSLALHGPTGMTWVAQVPEDRLSGITVLAARRLQARPLEVEFGDPSQTLAIELELGGETVEVLGLHPPSPTSGARAAARDNLLADAADWVASRGRPVLVVGDLNASPWSHAYRTLRLQGGLHDTMRDSGLQASWPVGWGPMMIPIDHALHTDGLVAVDRRTGPSLGSAHYPVLVTVTPTSG